MIFSRAPFRLSPHLDATVLLSSGASEFDCGVQIAKRSPSRDRQREHRDDVGPTPGQRTTLITDGSDDNVARKRMIMGFAHGVWRGERNVCAMRSAHSWLRSRQLRFQDREGMRTRWAFLPSSLRRPTGDEAHDAGELCELTFSNTSEARRTEFGDLGFDALRLRRSTLASVKPSPDAVYFTIDRNSGGLAWTISRSFDALEMARPFPVT